MEWDTRVNTSVKYWALKEKPGQFLRELSNCSEIRCYPELGTQCFHRKAGLLLLACLLITENKNSVLDASWSSPRAVLSHWLETLILCICKIPIWKIPKQLSEKSWFESSHETDSGTVGHDASRGQITQCQDGTVQRSSAMPLLIPALWGVNGGTGADCSQDSPWEVVSMGGRQFFF